jgi:two-component system response regulator PilR (NtrC family)
MSGCNVAGKILVVDDEVYVRQTIQMMLARRGFGVLEAADGEEAVAAVSADPDGLALVLLDVTMPGMGGKETLAAIKGIRSDLPVVILSGYAWEEPPARDAHQPDGFLQKPFQMGTLYEIVDSVLG